MYLVGVESEPLYFGSRASCHLSFFQFIIKTRHFGINVLRAYGSYQHKVDVDVDFFHYDEGEIIFLIKIDSEKLQCFVQTLTSLIKNSEEFLLEGETPKFFHEDGTPYEPDETKLREFMKEYDLSFKELEYFGLDYPTFLFKRILRSDYVSPNKKKTTRPEIDPFLLPTEGLDYPKGQFRTEGLDRLLSFNTEEEAEKAFIFNLMRIWTFDDKKEADLNYADFCLSHRVNDRHPSIQALQSVFEYISDKNKLPDNCTEEEFRDQVFQRSSEFLPNLSREEFDQSTTTVVAECLSTFLANEIVGHPMSKKTDKKGFLETERPITEEENRRRDEIRRQEAASWDMDFNEITFGTDHV
ncbi:hypothetical protein N9734_00545 [Alphaproteobacteria bacterium]|nr:hypothetical protein [Alphaproteobacteria bacterium]MDC1073434.1 hypothetical protein [Gammaproteobacteria bacterium]